MDSRMGAGGSSFGNYSFHKASQAAIQAENKISADGHFNKARQRASRGQAIQILPLPFKQIQQQNREPLPPAKNTETFSNQADISCKESSQSENQELNKKNEE